ncbi:unnamed protein product [Linum trigynum]|uniref:Uncharacterized protein n=1 Tax=Linum trigynum TaxID=586398 RepID=A0AAV2CXF3_9ROSI
MVIKTQQENPKIIENPTLAREGTSRHCWWLDLSSTLLDRTSAGGEVGRPDPPSSFVFPTSPHRPNLHRIRLFPISRSSIHSHGCSSSITAVANFRRATVVVAVVGVLTRLYARCTLHDVVPELLDLCRLLKKKERWDA